LITAYLRFALPSVYASDNWLPTDDILWLQWLTSGQRTLMKGYTAWVDILWWGKFNAISARREPTSACQHIK